MNIGLIGYGAFGAVHARVLEELGVLRLIVDSEVERLDAAAERHPDVQRYYEVEDALDEDCEVFVVAVPISAHSEVVERLLKADRHVLCEKPLSPEVHHLRDLQFLADERGLVLQEGLTFLHDPGIHALAFHTRRLGAVGYVRLEWSSPKTGDLGIGALRDTGPHPVSILRLLIGPRPVKHANRLSAYSGDAEMVSDVGLSFMGGATASLHVSWLGPEKRRRIEVHCERGWVTWDGDHVIVNGEPVYFMKREPLKEQALSFIESVSNIKPHGVPLCWPTPEMSLVVAQTIDNAFYGRD